MPTSSRFAVATQILTVMAVRSEQDHASEALAGWANTNATVIRRILQMLGRASITTSRMGASGGTRLARPANKISLDDVYRAVEDEVLFAMPRCEPDATCMIGEDIGQMVIDATRRAEGAMRTSLAQTTISDLARATKAGAARDAEGALGTT